MMLAELKTAVVNKETIKTVLLQTSWVSGSSAFGGLITGKSFSETSQSQTTEQEEKYIRVSRRLTGPQLAGSVRSINVSTSTVKRRLRDAGLLQRHAIPCGRRLTGANFLDNRTMNQSTGPNDGEAVSWYSVCNGVASAVTRFQLYRPAWPYCT